MNETSLATWENNLRPPSTIAFVIVSLSIFFHIQDVYFIPSSHLPNSEKTVNDGEVGSSVWKEYTCDNHAFV